MERAVQAASQSLTDHWRCQCLHPSGCSAAVVPLGWGLGSVLGVALACVVALILGREAGRGLADFCPSPLDFGGAHCCIVTLADFHVSPLSCARISVCGVEVSNLLLLLQGCEETDKVEQEGKAGIWEFTVPKAKHSV